MLIEENDVVSNITIHLPEMFGSFTSIVVQQSYLFKERRQYISKVIQRNHPVYTFETIKCFPVNRFLISIKLWRTSDDIVPQ